MIRFTGRLAKGWRGCQQHPFFGPYIASGEVDFSAMPPPTACGLFGTVNG